MERGKVRKRVRDCVAIVIWSGGRQHIGCDVRELGIQVINLLSHGMFAWDRERSRRRGATFWHFLLSPFSEDWGRRFRVGPHTQTTGAFLSSCASLSFCQRLKSAASGGSGRRILNLRPLLLAGCPLPQVCRTCVFRWRRVVQVVPLSAGRIGSRMPGLC